ncbi:MAG: D-2-hydroxyacid dehydrogenase [Lachnospiraceae bacterium]|jgi:glycerate dehydrogenase|nr:D-2-hydroxyacid dehydrogenase [Lachnospiraceae bacterium]
MKTVVIQESVMQPNLTAEEISAVWHRLDGFPEVDELVIEKPGGYPDLDQLHSYIGDAEAAFGVWISPRIINEEFLKQHPKLRYIAMLGHGFEPFDAAMTRRLGLTITNTVYGGQTIAEYAWALLMEVCHHVTWHSDKAKKTDWTNRGNQERYGVLLTPQIELYGKTAGVIGIGAIGLAFARMAAGFGMKVVSYSRTKRTGPEYDFIEQVGLDELLSRSDVISVHAPHNPGTDKMLDGAAFDKMKEGVILINTARGGLIDEDALVAALRSGKVYGAGLDVLRDEPFLPNHPIFAFDNVLVTEHIAWLTRESRLRACSMAIDNFRAYLDGKPVSVIN